MSRAKPLLMTLPLAAIIAAAALLLAGRGGGALQAPRMSLDMATGGNAYDEASNTMVLGPTENCLTTAPSGNNAQHNHIVHLILQDSVDLIGWQARLNYDGGRMRPSTVNFSPFSDAVRGQNISFTNLPIDSASGVHRDLVSASTIPPAAPGPQSALVGAVYNLQQNFAISPDTPPKVPPDDTSYSAPGGGVLAAITLQVLAGQAGQPLLTMDLSVADQNLPGSDLQVFDGAGVQTINIPQERLGDGFHAESASCIPPAGIPPVPADDPGFPDVPPGDGAGGGTPVPGDTTPGASPGDGTGGGGASPSRTSTISPTPNGDNADDADGEDDGGSGGDGDGTPVWLYVIIAVVVALAAGGAFAAWRYRSRLPWLRP